MTRYVNFRGAQHEIDAIRRSGVKIDPMSNPNSNWIIRVADWVPGAVKTWQDADGYGGMELEEYLRKVGGRTPVP